MYEFAVANEDWAILDSGYIYKKTNPYNNRTKELFHASRGSLCSWELAKNLRKEGFKISHEQTRKLMERLNLSVKQRVAYKVTTQRKNSDEVGANLLNQNFNPVTANEMWA